MQHFIVDVDLTAKEIHLLDKDVLHQMKSVLRFKVGDAVALMDGRGTKATGKILELHKKGARIGIEGHESLPLPPRMLRLCVAVSKKPSTFELILQKATELGVTDIIPLQTEFSQVSELKKLDRLQLIIKEATEQCERSTLPTLHPMVRLDELPLVGRALAGDARTYELRLSEVILNPHEAVTLIIGPEGGLSQKELNCLQEKGVTLFLLGESVLRMETAAIAALSVLQFG